MTAVSGERSTLTTVREVVHSLAPIDRAAGSPGEAQAAGWLAERFAAAGADNVAVERAECRPGFAAMLAGACAAGAGLGLAALRRQGARPLAAAGGLALGALIVDDISNGPRLLRRLTCRTRPTQNVVARIGDEDAPRTLVVLAHHDAANTGFIFDDSLQQALAERFPGLIERTDTAPPMWAPVWAGPAMVGLGAVLGSRTLVGFGTVISAGATVALGDFARSRPVPGANDNLSGCAALVAIAERLSEQPIDGLRVILASCGAEEVCQGGIYGFLDDHRDELPRESTVVINIDTVGSPRLVMLEGEGPVFMEDYPDPSLRDLVADAAADAGVTMRRGQRATSSTDSVVFARAGYPVATLVSFDHAKSLSNYHKMSDTAENLDYGTVAEAVEVTIASAERIAQRG